MATPRTLSAREIASLVGGELTGPGGCQIAGVAPLDRAGPGDLSFLASARYLSYFQRTSAGAVLVSPEFRAAGGGPATRIVVANPHHALARLLPRLYPAPPVTWGVDPTARVGRGARWTGRIALGPGAHLGVDVTLGQDCVIGAGARVGDGCRLGDRCHVESQAVVFSNATLGSDVVIRTGARVGGVGFGFVQNGDRHLRITHVGRCVVGDDVEIGANTTIDRGSVADTVVGPGTKIDSLVHIGHNVRIGRGCLVMAQVGIAGSTDVEDRVVLGGQAGLTDHVRVGSGARIGAQAGVIGDVAPGLTVSGYPARHHREVLRQAAALRRLEPLVRRLESLAGPPRE